MITIAAIIAAGVQPTQARAFVVALGKACDRFDIATRPRLAGFLAQAAHESAGLTRLEENLNYTTPERIRQVFPSKVPSLADAQRLVRNPKGLANRVYAQRLGNGDESSGDGWLYRGRGLFQLTGRANYMAAGDALGIDLKREPDRVAEPEFAALTAAWFWSTTGCNQLMDRQDIDGTTRKINGPALLGREERRERFMAAQLELP